MKNQRLAPTAAVAVLILVLISRLWYSIDRPICEEAQSFFQKSINSEITERYIDYDNHARLILRLSNNEDKFTFTSGNRESILYKKSAIGDSIKKNNNSSLEEIKREGKTVFSDYIHFYRCDSLELVDHLRSN